MLRWACVIAARRLDYCTQEAVPSQIAAKCSLLTVVLVNLWAICMTVCINSTKWSRRCGSAKITEPLTLWDSASVYGIGIEFGLPHPGGVDRTEISAEKPGIVSCKPVKPAKCMLLLVLRWKAFGYWIPFIISSATFSNCNSGVLYAHMYKVHGSP